MNTKDGADDDIGAHSLIGKRVWVQLVSAHQFNGTLTGATQDVLRLQDGDDQDGNPFELAYIPMRKVEAFGPEDASGATQDTGCGFD